MSTAFLRTHRHDRRVVRRSAMALPAHGARAAAASLLPLLALAFACLDGAAIHAAGQLLRMLGAGH